MRGRKKLSSSMNQFNQNQFLDDTPSPIKPRAISKDIRVKKLEERNVKLQEEIIRIQRTLSQADEKVHYGVRLPEIKGDVIRKELENAYKQIKHYEYQVLKKKKLESEETFVEQVRKLERVLKEKQIMADKLRKEIIETKKQSNDLMKLLKNDKTKKEQVDKETNINADIKWLHQKIKKAEAKRSLLNSNLQKQQQQIQKIEKDLTTKHQYEKNDIEGIRNRVFNATTFHQTNISKEDDRDSDQELQPIELRDQILLQERSSETFALLVNQVKLYRKLDKDYQGKIEMLVREKEDAEDRNFKSRNKLVQIEYEIQRVQSTIADKKKEVDPKNLKPTKMEMIVQQKRRAASSFKLNKAKLTMPHTYKFNEIGEATKAGKRFIDRTAVGKRPAKIIGVVYYQRKDGQNQLMGLQAIYMSGTVKKKGLLNVLADISELDAKQFSLEPGDFVKTIDVMTNSKGRVVGVSMVSKGNVMLKGGAMTSLRHPIEMDEQQYPVCLYGCLLPDGIEMLGSEMVKEQ